MQRAARRREKKAVSDIVNLPGILSPADLRELLALVGQPYQQLKELEKEFTIRQQAFSGMLLIFLKLKGYPYERVSVDFSTGQITPMSIPLGVELPVKQLPEPAVHPDGKGVAE